MTRPVLTNCMTSEARARPPTHAAAARSCARASCSLRESAATSAGRGGSPRTSAERCEALRSCGHLAVAAAP
eukprot:2342749-Prymnesium_polylepis.1